MFQKKDILEPILENITLHIGIVLPKLASFATTMTRLNEHLEEVGETYSQHLFKAAGFALTMLAGGIACLVHALFPFLFERTGSDCIRRLHGEMVENRKPKPDVGVRHAT